MKTQVNASVRMPSALHMRVVSLAESRQRTPHALMLQAIESYVTREEMREAWRREGIAAWEEYQRTGLHLTGDEVSAWIDQIRQGKKTPMPKCHV
ncbi:MAG: CopG family transcriptional regulator [Deltaproteobacteria bacterium]|jgi:predicted transcriptional regulator|nr:CopG family transcriptional regulator [Deltaproteobacteria bacterium]